MPKIRPFGYSLLLDFYNCEPEILDNLDKCHDFLDTLVEKIGMKKQSPPYIFRSPKEYPDKAGLSGWVPLIESGIQLHTLVPKHFASLDIYTCGECIVTDTEKIIEEAKTFFQSDKFERQFLRRGQEYYKSI